MSSPNTLSVIPNLTLFAALLSNNALLVWTIGLWVIAGFVLITPQCMILISRIFLAYSFHSVGPSFITTVSEKALKQIAPD